MTTTGAVVSEQNLPSIMKEGMLREKKTRFHDYYFVLRGDTRFAFFLLLFCCFFVDEKGGGIGFLSTNN